METMYFHGVFLRYDSYRQVFFYFISYIFFFNDNRAMNVGLGLPEGVSIYDAKITPYIRCYGLTIVVLLCVPLQNISERVLCILK